MSKFVFKPNDVFTNRIKTHPQCDFFVYGGVVYINNMTHVSGAGVNANYTSVPKGYISLYEMNINRSSGMIYPWIYATNKMTFRNLMKQPNLKTYSWPSSGSWGAETYGYPTNATQITSSYPLSASISRKLTTLEVIDVDPKVIKTDYRVQVPSDPMNEPLRTVRLLNRTGSALANIARKYTRLSKHFVFTPTGSHRSQLYANQGGQGSNSDFLQRDLTRSPINMLFIPSIFYGSTIKKGSVSLKYYISGAETAVVSDERKNGEVKNYNDYEVIKCYHKNS